MTGAPDDDWAAGAGRRALAYLGDRREALIAFARRLVAAPTPNPPGDERAAVAVAQAELRSLGFGDLEVLGPRPERANLICRHDTRRPGPVLLLNGHLDTKPTGPLEAWTTAPYAGVLRDGRLYGLGAADMKGPDAALVYGLAAAVRAAGDRLRGQIILALTADEEGEAADGARYLVRQAGLRADACLIAEPCGVLRPWDSLPLISRGFCALRFTIRGRETHSAVSDRLPTVNASVEAARLLLFLDEHLRLTYPPTALCPGGPTINLGATLKGGRALAIVPGAAEFTADVRTLPGMTRQQIGADLDRALAAFGARHPAGQVAWEFVPGNLAWTPPTQIDPGQPLVTAVQAAATRVLGAAPPFGYFPGGTDAIWWQGEAGIPTIPAFGPGLLSDCHQPDESVGLEDLAQAAAIYALAVIGYLGRSGAPGAPGIPGGAQRNTAAGSAP